LRLEVTVLRSPRRIVEIELLMCLAIRWRLSRFRFPPFKLNL